MFPIRTDLSAYSSAEALSRAHKALLENLRSLEDSVGPASPEGAAELVARLGALHSQISEHFRFEEQNGYMEVVKKREPRLEHRIAQLGAEHRQLLGLLDALVSRARRPDPGLRSDVKNWVESVRQHEVRENELVQDAFNFDIGTED
jgi:hypothetical protein